MSAVAVVLALAAPLGGPSIDTAPDLAPVSLVEYVNTPDAPDPPPIPDPIVVPPEAVISVEIAASVVTPKPPPPPPPPIVQQAVARIDHADAIARAASSPNGQIPADALCALSWDPSSALRCDAAQALERAAADGMPQVALTDAYRSYADQVAVKASRGSYAATPGTSNHGEGLAIDVPEPMRSWLHRNGTTYGWHNPPWARGYEPWHFLYQP